MRYFSYCTKPNTLCNIICDSLIRGIYTYIGWWQVIRKIHYIWVLLWEILFLSLSVEIHLLEFLHELLFDLLFGLCNLKLGKNGFLSTIETISSLVLNCEEKVSEELT